MTFPLEKKYDNASTTQQQISNTKSNKQMQQGNWVYTTGWISSLIYHTWTYLEMLKHKSTWTSMCLGRVIYFSSKIVSTPKEAAASRCAPKNESTNSPGPCTILIPWEWTENHTDVDELDVRCVSPPITGQQSWQSKNNHKREHNQWHTFPPPPWVGFIKIGYPILSASDFIRSTSCSWPWYPGTSGTPAAPIILFDALRTD